MYEALIVRTFQSDITKAQDITVNLLAPYNMEDAECRKDRIENTDAKEYYENGEVFGVKTGDPAEPFLPVNLNDTTSIELLTKNGTPPLVYAVSEVYSPYDVAKQFECEYDEEFGFFDLYNKNGIYDKYHFNTGLPLKDKALKDYFHYQGFVPFAKLKDLDFKRIIDKIAKSDEQEELVRRISKASLGYMILGAEPTKVSGKLSQDFLDYAYQKLDIKSDIEKRAIEELSAMVYELEQLTLTNPNEVVGYIVYHA
jgi:hypothetical protein